MNILSKRWVSSEKGFLQVFGTVFSHVASIAAFILIVLGTLSVLHIVGLRNGWWSFLTCFETWSLRRIALGISVVLCALTGYVVRKLNPIFSLRTQELRITWAQVIFLVTIGLVIVAIIENIDIKAEGPTKYVIGILGVVLSWIFQDAIKSVVAFFYLRINGLLKVGDWIEVSKHDINGIVKLITLTTVTIENWDTTTSAFPTYILHAEHFVNKQDMLAGKTHGRRMMKNFIINTKGVHPLTSQEVEKIKMELSGIPALRPYTDALKAGEMNISAFRKYTYQMLYCHHKVSHYPRLIVSWQEQMGEGLPMRIYAFITESSLVAFEWEESRIVEQVVEALPWFGLKLYQKISASDMYDMNTPMTEIQKNE